MNNRPLVSICTPVYNGGESLENCIKGALNQTYENYEYIIIDNASTDNTPFIIEKYRKKYPEIRVIRNEKTVSMEDNFNLCAKYTSDNSKWIKYALADDYLFPDCVEKMVKVGESDDMIGIVSAYRMAGRHVTNLGLSIEQNVLEGAEILKQQILRKLHVASSSPNTVMYRRNVFLEMNGFNNKYDLSDTELAFRILDKYKLGFVHYVLTRSGRDGGGGEYYAIIHGLKIIEYLDFGYKNLSSYKSVSFDKKELDYLRMYYADKIVDFMMTKMAYFEWDDMKRMIRSTPDDIKRELKNIFLNNVAKYTKKYFSSLYNIGDYMKKKK
ncbi:MAG: glycosyltransferase family 2 protein [Nitrospiraceae bacterium]|nr:MAG: glycosyltransferase family 2 protein [Nitrospiraceae bacterium]